MGYTILFRSAVLALTSEPICWDAYGVRTE